MLHAASIPRRVASRDFSHFLERERGELRHGWGRAEGDGGWVVFSFSGFQGLFVFSFICHCARTRARVALSRVGLSPASAAAMVRGEKASAIWGALRVGEGLSGLVLIGWSLFRKNLPSKQSPHSCFTPLQSQDESRVGILVIFGERERRAEARLGSGRVPLRVSLELLTEVDVRRPSPDWEESWGRKRIWAAAGVSRDGSGGQGDWRCRRS